ncbi:MAG: glycosyltransferase family 2 protein [Chitinophagia bacterium]|nr:glycosyltransferase family 2 protein [Chitinophagia bacterium]
MISVLVLTRNEEADLPGCLASVAWSDDVHVFDSMSTDATVAIAEAAGARVYRHAFSGYAAQRNAALAACTFTYEWILVLDADERYPAASVPALKAFVSSASDDVGAFRLKRRDHFQGRWLKHAQMSPYYIRLLRFGRVAYHREVNEIASVDGRVEELPIAFDHHPFSKGIDHWLARHDRYATMEADRLLEERNGAFRFSWTKAFFAGDFHERRYHQKGLYYRMPFRPVLKWVYLVFVRRAFLDGMPGMRYAWLQTNYERLINRKVRAKRKTGRV